MSLDVYLKVKSGSAGLLGSGIFIREDGQTKEISREEWDRRYPGRDPVVVTLPEGNGYSRVYDANITHNLGLMADAAGIYKHLWRPDENSITHARQLIEPLRDGLATLQSDPDRFRALNPENGWGSYEWLVEFVAGYLAACIAYPEAEVSVSR